MTDSYGLTGGTRQYRKAVLNDGDLGTDPLKSFRSWLMEAVEEGETEPEAMSLSACGDDGPSSRIVYLKDILPDGLVFYTNLKSRKGRQFDENPFAAALFFWPKCERQVRVEGSVKKLDGMSSDHYFNQRPDASKIAAIVSPQSEEIPDRPWLDRAFRDMSERLKGKELVRPDHWGACLIVPHRIEFWQGRPDRLNDRIEFLRKEANTWRIRRLAP